MFTDELRTKLPFNSQGLLFVLFVHQCATLDQLLRLLKFKLEGLNSLDPWLLHVIPAGFFNENHIVGDDGVNVFESTRSNPHLLEGPDPKIPVVGR